MNWPGLTDARIIPVCTLPCSTWNTASGCPKQAGFGRQRSQRSAGIRARPTCRDESPRGARIQLRGRDHPGAASGVTGQLAVKQLELRERSSPPRPASAAPATALPAPAGRRQPHAARRPDGPDVRGAPRIGRALRCRRAPRPERLSCGPAPAVMQLDIQIRSSVTTMLRPVRAAASR